MNIGFASLEWAVTVLDEKGHPTPGGSCWYRCVLPAKALAARGHSTVVGTPVFDMARGLLGVREWDGGVTMDLDVVVIQRCMNAEMPDCVRRAREEGQVVLADVDDWWEGLDPGHRAYAATDPRFNGYENRDYLRAVLASADTVTCSTPFLAERYRKLNRTEVVRNAVDPERWPLTRPKDDVPTLGWVGSLPTRSRGDVGVLRGFLGRFCAETGCRVVHAGASPLGESLAEAAELDRYGVEVEVRPQSSIYDYPRLWDGIDIALVPLGGDNFSAKAKSAVKGMEASCRAIPFVASASDEYRWLYSTHQIGSTAASPAEWRVRLRRLLDMGARHTQGMNNRLRVTRLNGRWSGGEWEQAIQHARSLASA